MDRSAEFSGFNPMIKWLLTTLIALALISALTPALWRFGLGRLPGDMRIRFRGREIYIPFTTTVLLSLALTLLVRLL